MVDIFKISPNHYRLAILRRDNRITITDVETKRPPGRKLILRALERLEIDPRQVVSLRYTSPKGEVSDWFRFRSSLTPRRNAA